MTKKQWLSLQEQEDLMRGRGLRIDQREECVNALRRIGYYHLSGYARFFQTDPRYGDNSFRVGTTLSEILELVQLDSDLRTLCIEQLAKVELALRTGFAHTFGERVGAYDHLLETSSFVAAGSSRPIPDLIKESLDQSKQAFIIRHRETDASYSSLPVWIAVEALPFGTLSRAIEYCAEPSVATTIADDLGVARTGFSSQVHSFVALRNSCAHLSRLWNDVSKVPPHVPNNRLRKAKKKVGSFSPQSYYHVLVGLDVFCSAVGSPGLLDQVNAICDKNATYCAGLLNPRPYA